MDDHKAELLRACISAGARCEYLLDLYANAGVVRRDYVVDVLRVIRDELREVAERATSGEAVTG